MPLLVPPAPTGTSFTTARPIGPVPSPAPIPADRLLTEDTLPGGTAVSFTLPRHHTLRLTALEAGANVSFLCFNRHELLDRYNMADTLKGQHTAKLTTGFILVSDMGRAMASITGDTLGWHDPLGGHDTAAHVEKKWGAKNYQSARNAWQRNSRDHFLIELGKHGLNARDLVPNVNFFSKLTTDDAGHLAFVPNHAQAGDHIDLRAEMDLPTTTVAPTAPKTSAPSTTPSSPPFNSASATSVPPLVPSV